MTNTQYALYVATIVALTAIGCAPVDPEPDTQPSIDGGLVSDAAVDAQLIPDGPMDKQNGSQGHPTLKPTAVDYERLPLAIKVQPWPYPGWSSLNDLWLYSLWTRDGVIGGGGKLGNWYRGVGGDWTLTKRPFGNSPATCQAGFLFSATCTDTFGTKVDVACPNEIRLNEYPREWRSYYNTTANQIGWFYWGFAEAGVWAAFAYRVTAPFAGVFITGEGRQVNCSYRLPATVDSWVEYRNRP